jgi:cell division protein FtsW
MFIAGTRLRYLVPTVVAGFAGLAFAIHSMPERTGRFLAFLYPEKYPADAYQTVQGLIALGSGGVEGLGLGNGRQKMAYLPFAHTDFIFPVIGEELGLRFTLLVVFTYLVIIMCGATIAMRARDRFGMLLGFGITVIIALQAAVNIGVTTAMLPNKGLPLPFISYGGTNLVFCLLSVGMLINIYRQGLNDREDKGKGVVLRARTRNARRVVRL